MAPKQASSLELYGTPLHARTTISREPPCSQPRLFVDQSPFLYRKIQNEEFEDNADLARELELQLQSLDRSNDLNDNKSGIDNKKKTSIP
jgi:hypothetical protein